MSELTHKELIFVGESPEWICQQKTPLFDATLKVIKFEHDYIGTVDFTDEEGNIYQYRNENIQPLEKILGLLHRTFHRLKYLKEIKEHEKRDGEDPDG